MATYQKALKRAKRNMTMGGYVASEKIGMAGDPAMGGNINKMMRQTLKAGIRANAKAAGLSISNAQVRTRAAVQLRAIKSGSEAAFNKRTAKAIKSGKAKR